MDFSTNSQHPKMGGDHLLEDNYSNLKENLTANATSDKLAGHASGFSMLAGILLLTLGAFFSEVLQTNGLQGFVFCIIALGFSLIYYGVSEDSEVVP